MTDTLLHKRTEDAAGCT